ncbi:Vp12 [Banna virus]|uniref:Vp12 n=1 Tax=Banna virus TaxID=77763 RepID=Q9YWP4_BANNV|nr:Vp12 [Banna virus]
MDPVSVVHSFARSQGLPLDFETVGCEGPSHDPRFVIECKFLDFQHQCTDSSKKRAIQKICVLISNDLKENGLLEEAKTFRPEYKSIAQVYGKFFKRYIAEKESSVITPFKLVNNQILLHDIDELVEYGSSEYMFRHMLLCYIIHKRGIDIKEMCNMKLSPDYIECLSHHLTSTVDIDVHQQDCGNLSVVIFAKDNNIKKQLQIQVSA